MESQELVNLASLGVPAATYNPASAPRMPIDEALNVPSYIPHSITHIRTSSLDAICGSKATHRGKAREWISKHITERWARQPEEGGWKDEEAAVVGALNKYPNGHPRYAAFLHHDDNFMIFRKFGYVQARLLLEKQEQLRILEEELYKRDEIDNRENRMHLRCRQLGVQDGSARHDLLEKLEKKFVEYAQLLTIARKLRCFERPTTRDYQSVRNWHYNKHPVLKQDGQWIHAKEDIVALRPSREPEWIESLIERLLTRFNCSLVQFLFTTKETQLKAGNDPYYYVFAVERIQAVVLTITTLLISILLILPILACYLIVTNISSNKGYAICIGILLMFTLIFCGFVMVFTKAKRHEVLAATSAYCAVLVVFLGNVGK